MEEARYIPYSAEPPPPGPAVVIAPHGDDEVLGCGGAALIHASRGEAVTVVIATDDASDRLRRRREAHEAASIMGVAGPIFLGFPDRRLDAVADELKMQLTKAFVSLKPSVVYAPGAQEAHPDHFAVAQATRAAVLASGLELEVMFYEVGVPLAPNHLIDITAVEPRLGEALACYQTQLAARGYDAHKRGLAAFRAYTLEAEVTAAEAYLRVPAAELVDRARLFGRTRQGDTVIGP